MRTKRQMLKADSAKLAGFYADAHNKLVRILVSKQSSITSRSRAKEMLGEIRSVIDGLETRTKRYVENAIPLTYNRFAKEAVQTIKKSTGKAKFTLIHEEAIKAFIDETNTKFATGLTATTRTAQTIVSQALRNNLQKEIAKAKILGSTLDDTAKELVKQIEAQGITGLVDKRGRQLNIASYAKTLAYTQFAESGRLAVQNVALENGFDLVIVSSHNSAHKECAVWEGRVLSLTGATKGFPTLEEAKASGIFHPNCQHTYTIIDESMVTNDMR